MAAFAGANILSGVAERGADGLTSVRLDDRTTIYSTDETVGAVDVIVYPWDVSLALGPHSDSALNVVTGEILSVARLGNRVRIRLEAMTAEITTRSAERLGLRPGAHVVASFKATATRLFPRS